MANFGVNDLPWALTKAYYYGYYRGDDGLHTNPFTLDDPKYALYDEKYKKGIADHEKEKQAEIEAALKEKNT